MQTTAPRNASSTRATMVPAPRSRTAEEEEAWGGRAKSNQGRFFELEGEARSGELKAFSTCWGLRSRLQRELRGVFLQQDHLQTGSALPLGNWKVWLHPWREENKTIDPNGQLKQKTDKMQK